MTEPIEPTDLVALEDKVRADILISRGRTGKPNPMLLTLTANDAEALCDRVDELEAHTKSLEAIVDTDLTFRDLEVKIRDGEVRLQAIGGERGGAPVYRLVAAMLYHLLLGEENELPPNYRAVEWKIKPGGEFEGIRIVGEIVREGGCLSHEIRRELEAKLDLALATPTPTTPKDDQ